MKHRPISVIAAFLLTAALAVPASAGQDATAEDGFAELGLPELDVTVTAGTYEGIPDEIEAGRYLVTLAADENTEELGGGGIAFLQATGLTGQEFLDFIFGAEDAEEDAEATPPEDEEDFGALPEEIYGWHYAGGLYVAPGETIQFVVDLTPGEWIAWAADPEAPQEPVFFEATGEMPEDLPEPEAGATITMGEYVITVSDGELVAGDQIVRLENRGAQPHFLALFLGPDDLTEEQIALVLEEEMDALMAGEEPVYSDLNPEEDLFPLAFTGTQSGDTVMWFPLSLEAGTYGLACFYPDIADGLPHAYHGMYDVIEVG